jgi:hypothetical protein
MATYTTTKFFCTPTVTLERLADGTYRIPGKAGLIAKDGKHGWRIEARKIRWGGFPTLRDAAAMLADLAVTE